MTKGAVYEIGVALFPWPSRRHWFISQRHVASRSRNAVVILQPDG
jgi:hypothetical protein